MYKAKCARDTEAPLTCARDTDRMPFDPWGEKNSNSDPRSEKKREEGRFLNDACETRPRTLRFEGAERLSGGSHISTPFQ